MKRMMAALLAGILMIACPVYAEEKLPLAGGWEASGDIALPEEAQEAFGKATEKLLGVNYEPVALLATQVVAGTNYCILCRSTVVSPGAETGYVLMYIYKDLQGNAEVLEIEDLEIGRFQNAVDDEALHTITISNETEEDIILSCPSEAKAGELVTIETCSVCDAAVYIKVNGQGDFGKFVQDDTYQFEMPDEDVEIYGWISTEGFAGS